MAKKKKAESLPVLKDEYNERSKYDWTTIRNDYIFGYKDAEGTVIYPKPKDLELRHNVPAQYISNRVTKEKWLKHREAHQNEVALANQKEHQKRLAKKAVKFDEDAATDAESAKDFLRQRMDRLFKLDAIDNARIEELRAEILEGREVDHELRQQLKPLVSIYEMETIAKTYILFDEVGRKALGIENEKPTLNQVNVQVNQSTPSASLQEDDEQRAKLIEEFFQNKNVRISQFGLNAPKEDEPYAIEAEIVEENDATESE